MVNVTPRNHSISHHHHHYCILISSTTTILLSSHTISFITLCERRFLTLRSYTKMTTSFTTTPTDDGDDDNSISSIINRIFVSIMFKFTIGEEFDSYRTINFIIVIMTTFCLYCSLLFVVMFISIIWNGIRNIKKIGINNNNNNNNKNNIPSFHDCQSSLSEPVQVQVPSSRDENNYHPHQRQRQLRRRQLRQQRTAGKSTNKQQDQLHLQRFNTASPHSYASTIPIPNNDKQQLVAPHHSYTSTIPISNNNKQQLFALSSSSSSSSTTGGDGHAYNNNNNNNNPYHPIISQEQHQVFLPPRTGGHHHHQQEQRQQQQQQQPQPKALVTASVSGEIVVAPAYQHNAAAGMSSVTIPAGQPKQQQPKALITASVSGAIVVAPAYQHNAAAGMSSVTIPAGQPKQHHQSDVSSINSFTYDNKDTHDDGMEEWNEDEYNKRFFQNVSIKDTTVARNDAGTTTTTTTLASTSGTPGSAPGSGPLSSVNKKKRSRRSAALELSETESDPHDDVANIQPQQQEPPRPSKKRRRLAEAKARAKEWNARTFGN